MHWSFRKFFTNLRSNLETFLFFILCKSLLCVTLSNAFFSFRLSNKTTLLLILLYTICIFFIISCKVVFIDLCLQAFIWMFNIELQASMTFCRCLNMMNFSILLSVLSNAIDLYIFALKYSFLFDFYIIIVTAILNWVDCIFFCKHFSKRECIYSDVLLMNLRIILFMYLVCFNILSNVAL